ncbi:MAG TPA: cell division protein SepF [Candidatus Aenigmarchaeota archaeon]|nr:cell division protein SepF [Candidatus Aenigmarchaeota archaeon]
MAMKDIMGKFKSGDEYVEIDMEEEKGDKRLLVEVERLDNYADSDRLQRKVREGSILLVKIKELKAKDMEELKRAVEKLRKTCLAINGDIAGMGEDWLIMTPPSAKVHREEQSN